jgi:hypothetical protein
MSLFLNIDQWVPLVTPVVLPIGPLNAIPFIHASYGIVLPLGVFIIAASYHFLLQWRKLGKQT